MTAHVYMYSSARTSIQLFRVDIFHLLPKSPSPLFYSTLDHPYLFLLWTSAYRSLSTSLFYSLSPFLVFPYLSFSPSLTRARVRTNFCTPLLPDDPHFFRRLRALSRSFYAAAKFMPAIQARRSALFFPPGCTARARSRFIRSTPVFPSTRLYRFSRAASERPPELCRLITTIGREGRTRERAGKLRRPRFHNGVGVAALKIPRERL